MACLTLKIYKFHSNSKTFGPPKKSLSYSPKNLDNTPDFITELTALISSSPIVFDYNFSLKVLGPPNKANLLLFFIIYNFMYYIFS